ncbi:phytoene/squalene synthase family protein [Marinilongibacter aquaticus]|uniref:phytoene/squalene synthase family protein n=1 Tax=Marinilongibacter aquaticus TaxID=2975157 RepID=UPI0021BD84DD|nr:phytoene/squalene synthase family protein [Marinilongibacter aquaticus]UBM58893.1 phytoene/squalene synthase family protein [Marinilongibacter aquaticus]
MKALFDQTSYGCSKLVTNAYSTSFSMGIRLFGKEIQPAIYAIYGFVRYADEIVDTFQGYAQAELLDEFEAEYEKALERRISLNPILNAFQEVVHRYDLHEYVGHFMESMRKDLYVQDYKDEEEYKAYIYGSADVVGLMCLRVFVNNDEQRFRALKSYAIRLGSAFQKVNFLRDIQADLSDLGRSYFPNLRSTQLDNGSKTEIIEDIEADFHEAFKGIVQLPMSGRFGVYLAYRYYLGLLSKLKQMDSRQIMRGRIRISNGIKCVILVKAFVRYKLKMI